MDIAFVVDSSGSIGRTNWERMKRFLKALVSRLDVSPSAAHIAAIAYSNSPVVVMRFNGVQDTNLINQLLDAMSYQRGFTYTDKALLLADSDIFQSSRGMRSNVPKVGFLSEWESNVKICCLPYLVVKTKKKTTVAVIIMGIIFFLCSDVMRA